MCDLQGYPRAGRYLTGGPDRAKKRVMVWRGALFTLLTMALIPACGDDEGTGNSLSGGSQTASASAGSSGSSGSGSSGGSGDASSGSASASDGSSSSSGGGSTGSETTGVGTTSDGTTSTTDGTSTSTSTSGTTGGGACNNGILDPGEQCDGNNLGGFTCESLGYGGGTLSCDAVMCILDTSLCEMGGSTGGTTG